MKKVLKWIGIAFAAMMILAWIGADPGEPKKPATKPSPLMEALRKAESTAAVKADDVEAFIYDGVIPSDVPRLTDAEFVAAKRRPSVAMVTGMIQRHKVTSVHTRGGVVMYFNRPGHDTPTHSSVTATCLYLGEGKTLEDEKGKPILDSCIEGGVR